MCLPPAGSPQPRATAPRRKNKKGIILDKVRERTVEQMKEQLDNAGDTLYNEVVLYDFKRQQDLETAGQGKRKKKAKDPAWLKAPTRKLGNRELGQLFVKRAFARAECDEEEEVVRKSEFEISPKSSVSVLVKRSFF